MRQDFKYNLFAKAVCLLVLLCSFLMAVPGCASTDGENEGFAAPADTVALPPGKSAWMRVDADHASVLIVNKGPASLEIRTPALGGDLAETVTLEPNESFRHQFYATRSFGFANENLNAWVRFHYYISGDNVKVVYHGSSN